MFKFKAPTENGILWAHNSRDRRESIAVFTTMRLANGTQWYRWNSYLDGERVSTGEWNSIDGARRAAVKSITSYRQEQGV